MEQYSRQMAVAVRREIRSADGPRFRELLAYYRQRGGPGLKLAEAEATERINRHQINYLK